MPQLKNFFKFISIGLLTVFAGEFQVQVLAAQKGMEGFVSTLVLYAFFLAAMYVVGVFCDRKNSPKRDVYYYFVGGLFGLVIEWSMGNGPWVNNGALQAGMFAWWAATFLVPRIFIQTADDVIVSVRRQLVIYLSIYSVLSTLVIIISPPALRPAFTGIILAASYITINFRFIPYLIRGGVSPVFARRSMIVLAIAGVAGLFI